VVRCLLGSVLLGAALLKLLFPAPPPWVAWGWHLPEGLWLAALEAEALLGLWLWWGGYPRLLWGVALGWFGLLAEVSFWSAWQGAVSCGCLGSGLQVSPWVLLGVDLGAVALLLWGRPAGAAAPRLAARGTWSGWALGAVGLLAVGLAGGRPGSGSAEVSVFPAEVDLGRVPAGSRQRVALTLYSAQAESLLLDELESSCPCVRGEGLPWRLEPGQRRPVAVEVDLSAEPEFRGRLQIELVGKSSGRVVFRTRLHLTVTEKSSSVGNDPPGPCPQIQGDSTLLETAAWFVFFRGQERMFAEAEPVVLKERKGRIWDGDGTWQD
jgi:hypothetical protein